MKPSELVLVAIRSGNGLRGSVLVNPPQTKIPDAVTAINRIRRGHNLPDYSGAVTQAALIDEMLKQRRYSLFFEGHRWLDLRRYNRLNTLPIDRLNDDVWSSFPLPNTEY